MNPNGLTIEALEKAKGLLAEVPPLFSETRIADAAEFIRWIGAAAVEGGGIFGVRILESPYMPKHMGVMLDSTGRVIGIFDMSDQGRLPVKERA